jgi:hypothetical protein
MSPRHFSGGIAIEQLPLQIIVLMQSSLASAPVDEGNPM